MLESVVGCRSSGKALEAGFGMHRGVVIGGSREIFGSLRSGRRHIRYAPVSGAVL